MLRGIDVSNWQPSMSFSNHDFVIIKASEGVGYKDPKLDTHYNNLHGKRYYGFYHYARPELGNTPEQEADWFLSLVGHHKGKALFVLDWEGNALSYSTDWALRWLRRVFQVTGVRPLIYLQASQEWTGKYANIIKEDFGLWVAHWGVSNPDVRHWSTWALWQYTDTPLDTNMFNGNGDTWMKYCAVQGGNNVSRETIEVGDTVTVKSVTDYNGVVNALWVLGTKFTVMEINGERVVIGRGGQVTGAWNINNLELA